MLLATSKALSAKLTVEVDYVRRGPFGKTKELLGPQIVKNGIQFGHRFVNAYVIKKDTDDENIYHYVMKRKITLEDRASKKRVLSNTKKILMTECYQDFLLTI